MLQVLLMLFTANKCKGEKNTTMLFGSFVLWSDEKKKKKKQQQNNEKFSNSVTDCEHKILWEKNSYVIITILQD